MAHMYVTLKIMPESAEISLEDLKNQIKNAIEDHEAQFKDDRTEFVPVAFGLKALHITFSVDEKKGTDEFEEAVREIEGIGSVEVINMTRALG